MPTFSLSSLLNFVLMLSNQTLSSPDHLCGKGGAAGLQ
jgi:hypothetical protein